MSSSSSKMILLRRLVVRNPTTTINCRCLPTITTAGKWNNSSTQLNESRNTTPVSSSSSQLQYNLLQNKVRTFSTTSNDGLSSFYSSFQEPDLFAFRVASGSSSANTDYVVQTDLDAPLRADIRAMGNMLGNAISKHNGPELLEKVEKMRLLAKEWRSGTFTSSDGEENDKLFQKLPEYAKTLSNDDLFLVSRAFTHFLAIVNQAERHHRARRMEQISDHSDIESGALYPKNDSCGGAIPQLLAKGISADDIYKTLSTQTTELILTAHPTEVNRRTILDKVRQLQQLLIEVDRYRYSGISAGTKKYYEMEQLRQALEREITSLWLSDEVSRAKPTVEQEAEKGTLVLETVLWQAVPQFLRNLDSTMKHFLGSEMSLPLTSAPIKFGSWMGGDRDGNPNVHPKTTRIVCLKNRAKAAELFANDLRKVRNELSITGNNKYSEQLASIVGVKVREPYRAMLDMILSKLDKTQKWAKKELENVQNGSTSPIPVDKNEIYLSQDDFRNDLMVIYDSLQESEMGLSAGGLLTDVLRNVSAFGLTLIPLDVRQESGRHEEAIDSICRYLGLGSFKQWDEQTRINWLTTQISSKRPLLRKGVWYEHPDIFTPTVIDTLETFSMISDQYEGSLGAYVISQATTASDVLTVLLLQIDAGVKKPLRIAPLFETLDDLNGAVSTMKTLFSLSTYMGIINGKQEVMIGYSDSAKDAGRLAASWAQYNTQEELAAVAREYNIDMTFFHGKGGTVGRGGNPQTFHAIMAHAPQTIRGYFRVTEQGEMINQNFGFPSIAERTLDIYTSAVMAEKLTPRTPVKQSWKNMMDELSDTSCDAYRAIVRNDPRFVPYFREATPEFSNLNIGSRPAKRNPTGGVESLRAIPWNFAWTQTRLNLPTWAGVGEALGSKLNSPNASERELIREMYRDWDTFRTIVDLVEMVLAKSEPSIAKHYEDVLVKGADAKELGAEVREKHLATENFVKEITGHKRLAENNKILTRALLVKNPYVDCLNVLQAETIKRMRETDGEVEPALNDALTTTITGIANGMGNTG